MMENLDEAGPLAASTLPPAMQTRLEACTEAERAQLETAWQLAGLGKQAETVPPIDTAWTRLQQALDSGGPAQGPRKPQTDRGAHRRRGRLRWSLVGLAVVVVVGVGLAQWRQPVTLHAPAGTTMTATLPDGSHAELNSGSTLAYQRRLFGWLPPKPMASVGNTSETHFPYGILTPRQPILHSLPRGEPACVRPSSLQYRQETNGQDARALSFLELGYSLPRKSPDHSILLSPLSGT